MKRFIGCLLWVLSVHASAASLNLLTDIHPPAFPTER